MPSRRATGNGSSIPSERGGNGTTGNTIARNAVYNNGSAGIGSVGIGVLNSTNAKVRRNNVHDNAKSGINLLNADASLVKLNQSHANGFDGIETSPGSTGNLLLNNITNGNGWNGIDVGDPGNTIKGNQADTNFNLRDLRRRRKRRRRRQHGHGQRRPVAVRGGVLQLSRTEDTTERLLSGPGGKLVRHVQSVPTLLQSPAPG